MIINKKSVLKIFYYLMAIDGVSEEENDKFQEISKQICGESFTKNQEEIIRECNDYINSISEEDDRFDMIQEGIDRELKNVVERPENGIASRMFIWNMLVLAHSDNDYSDVENRMISHISRIMKIDKSVFAEMKQLIIVVNSLDRQIKELEQSQRPYSEIQPLIEEAKNRQSTVVTASTALIEDEIIFVEPIKEEKESSVVAMGKKVGDSIIDGSKKAEAVVMPVVKDVGEFVSKGVSDVGSGVAKGAEDLKNGAGKFFGIFFD